MTWTTIAEMNAAHAADPGGATMKETLDRAVCVSLYPDAALSTQFMLEDRVRG